MNYKMLSYVDLLQIPAFGLAAKINCTRTMERVLWEAGMNINLPHETNWELHRALTTNIPQENYVVRGYGRTDEEYLKSGFARLEDLIFASGDKSLQQELLGLDATNTRNMNDVVAELPQGVIERIEAKEAATSKELDSEEDIVEDELEEVEEEKEV